MKIKGYYLDKEGRLNPADVFVYIQDTGRKNRGEIYCPIGQHSEADIAYINECTKISKEEYVKASKGYYTPDDYLQV